MRVLIVLLSLSFASCVNKNLHGVNPEVIEFSGDELIEDYKGSTEMPVDLLRVYTKLVNNLSAEDVDLEEIQKICVLGAISITTDSIRPVVNYNYYGEDLNIKFFKEKCMPKIVSLTKEVDGSYFIRTNTSALWFT